MPTDITNSIKKACQQLRLVSDSARLDAELLLAFVLGKNRTFLHTWPEQMLTVAQSQRFHALVEQRYQGQPIAYLLGYREFWSRQFLVSPVVLIPRPDTELLVEKVLDEIPLNLPCEILDLGTGSGAIAITLAAERALATVTATDISEAALDIARQNSQDLQVENIHFLSSHWFQKINPNAYDIIVSNPPYIDADDPHLTQGDLRFEPDNALISAQQGLQDIRLIADQARHYLKPGGALFLEHGYQQHQAVQAILKKLDYHGIQTERDLSGHPRLTWARWN